jgi:hypothetical protein
MPRGTKENHELLVSIAGLGAQRPTHSVPTQPKLNSKYNSFCDINKRENEFFF